MEDSLFNHSSKDYAERILDSIQIMANNAVKNAGYDRTIQATILSCTNASKGEYKCQYQDSKFLAYSPNIDTTYNDNALVFILVPGNDWDATKTIIGTVDKLGRDYSTLPQVSKYDQVGDNIFNIPNPTPECEMSTWEGTKTWTLYLYDETTPDPDILGVNAAKAEAYLKNADFIQIKAAFKSDILETQIHGKYGIRIYTKVVNSENLNLYELNSWEMIGNPEHFTDYIEQSVIKHFDKDNFERIEAIQLFVENYNEDDPPPTDIWVKNFSLTAQRELTPEQLTDGYLSILTPAGSIKFASDNPNKIILQAKIRMNGVVVEDDSEVKYYWFTRDPSVYPGSPNESGFFQISGARTEGWRCTNGLDSNNERMPASNTIELDDNALPAMYMDWKCVAIYQGLVMENDITIENRNARYVIQITSSAPLPFYESEGSTQLTAAVTQGSTVPNVFYWSKSNSYGDYTTLADWNTATTPTIQATEIPLGRYNKYYCSLYGGENNTLFLGCGEIVVANTTRQESTPGNYVLIIKNRSQVFKYDEDGISPTDDRNPNPVNVTSLTFTLSDIQGEDITEFIQQGDAEWYIPHENTLIEYDGSDTPIRTEDGYDVYNGLAFKFKLADYFDYSKIANSQILLKVTYDDVVVQDTTVFAFTKEGESGTNGTQYFCIIRPNTDNNYTKNRVFVREPSAGVAHWTFDGWTARQGEFPFKIDIYKGNNGTPVYSGYKTGEIGGIRYTIKWSIPGAHSSFRVGINQSTQDPTFEYTGLAIPTGEQIDDEYANILRAEVEITEADAATMYAFLPIGIQKSTASSTDDNDILLKTVTGNDNCYVGYSNVIYNADGENPRYSTTYPFEITGVDFEDIQIKGIEYTADEHDEQVEIGNHKTKLYKDDDDSRVKPVESYVGDIIDNAIWAQNGTITIYIPILFMLNKYGLKQLNAWDGTRIEIDEGAGWILAPRIGAGQKEDDNTFTGAVMGILRKEDTKDEVGIFAFGHGIRTFFVDAKTGKTIFGKGTNGIIVDPNEGSKIYGGGYIPGEHEDVGLLIDLEEPRIKWGNGNFEVDSQGNTIIKGNGEIAGWRLYPTFLASVNYEEGINGGGIRLDSQQDSVIFGSSTGNIYSGLHQNFESTEDGFYLSGDGLSIGSQFRVDKTGTIYASDGYIGGYRILVDNGTDGGTLALEHAQNAWKLRSAPIAGQVDKRYYVSLTKNRNLIVSDSKDGAHTADNDVTDECNIGTRNYPWRYGYFKRLYAVYKTLENGNLVNKSIQLGTEYTKIVLDADDWDANGQQTIDIVGITKDNDIDDKTKQFIQVVPAYASAVDYFNMGIVIIQKKKGQLVFQKLWDLEETIPDVTVFVYMTYAKPKQSVLNTPVNASIYYNADDEKTYCQWEDPDDEMFAILDHVYLFRRFGQPPEITFANGSYAITDGESVKLTDYDVTEKDKYKSTPYADTTVVELTKGRYYYTIYEVTSENQVSSYTDSINTSDTPYIISVVLNGAIGQVNYELMPAHYDDIKIVYKLNSAPASASDGILVEYITDLSIETLSGRFSEAQDLPFGPLYFKIFAQTDDGQTVSNTYLVDVVGSYEFSYTGQIEEFTVPTTGLYRIEAWGAQGSENGGVGSYSVGETLLSQGDKLYIAVGGQNGFNGGGSNMPAAPVINELTLSDYTNVRVDYKVYPGITYPYSSIVLAVKKDSVPIGVEDADKTIVLSESATSITVSGLDELSTYYFVIFIEDEQGNTASSEPQDCMTGELVLEDMTTWDTVSGKDMTVEYANGVNHISGTANGTWEYWWKELSVESGAEYRVTCQVMSTLYTTYFSHYDRIYMLENAYPGSQAPQEMAFAYGDYFPNRNGEYRDYAFTFIAPANIIYICTGFGHVWTGYDVDFYIKDLRLEKI